MQTRIAVIGDFNPSNDTHIKLGESLIHAAGESISVEWIGTERVSQTALDPYDGIWCAPASPYASLKGALQGIRFAREHNVPFIGTCAGFRHAVIEYAQNVCGILNAVSEEYNIPDSPLIISRLQCSLVGKKMRIEMLARSLSRRLYGTDHAEEQYYCNFGLNEEYRPELESHGLRFTGRSEDGEARLLEIPDHPFFLGTLFVPQVSSLAGRPHPLIAGFAAAAAEFRSARSAKVEAAAR